MPATLDRDRLPTLFAPGERCPPEILSATAKRILEDPIVQTILRAIPGSVLILNQQRQILAANQEILDALGLKVADTLVGARPGEAFACLRASEGPSGCGTSRHCRACGAVIAILAALEQEKPVREECTLSIRQGERFRCLNLSVFAAPLTILGQKCVEFVFCDVSDLKMKEAVERLFLHDLRNALSAVMGWGELAGESKAAAEKLVKITQDILGMVEAHSCLQHAESGDLCVNTQEVEVSAVLETLRDAVSTAPYARNKKLTLEIDADDRRTLTRIDPALLNRVLVNMVKNAFEAIREGEVVRVRFHSDGNGTGIFSVYNRGTIPEDTQLRMFQRAFTTKGGIGRGFGTYGMKLLGENYLGGEVGFESTQDSTTRFYISLPSPGKATH